MEKNYITVTLKIRGMTCAGCENRIERTLKNKKGVANAIVSYGKGTALVTYNPNKTDQEEIIGAIKQLGYDVARPNKTACAKPAGRYAVRRNRSDASSLYEPETRNSKGLQAIGVLVILLALYVIVRRSGGLDLFNIFPQAEAGMGFGMLFVIGLLTSAHCVAMCGGINLSQCVPYQARSTGGNRDLALKPSILYNSGRVISYTAVGGIVGALGSAVSFSNAGKGFIALAAGMFMVIMGLNMLNVFPWLRKFNPRMPRAFAEKIDKKKDGKGPLYVGLLNGLMPCGPLQAMQLYALSTGDPAKGALSMLVFSLGTVPLMFGLGALSSILTKKHTARMMTVGAALVIVMGAAMFGRGMALAGYAMPFASGLSGVSAAASVQGATAELIDGVQVVTTSLESGRYMPIVVQKGIPVQWNIRAEARDINGCNNKIIIPEYNLEIPLKPGDNIIEFTPDKSGVILYSCWMGMIRSQIGVVDDLSDPTRIPDSDGVINNNLPSCCGGISF